MRKDHETERIPHYRNVDQRLFGFNKTKFEYPIFRDQQLSHLFDQYYSDQLLLPNEFIPLYDVNEQCKHAFRYKEYETVLLYDEVIIYYQSHEKVKNIKVYGRQSEGPCSCTDQPDTHQYLLYNLGGGNFIHYSWLLDLQHFWGNGLPTTSSGDARKTTFQALGKKTKLNDVDLDKAHIGFSHLIVDRNEDFTCTRFCKKDTPDVLVGDGVCTAPTNRKVDHIEEFEPHPSDETELPQSTKSQQRKFLANKSERVLVQALVKGEISAEEFIRSDQITSENGQLVKIIVERLEHWFTDCPAEYNDFFSDISKETSIPGLIQVNSNEPLDILSDYCNERLDLRAHQNLNRLQIVEREIPALWSSLKNILKLEKRSNYLPKDVASVVLELISIWKNIFINAAERSDDQYFWYPEDAGELPTQCYPNWDVIRHN